MNLQEKYNEVKEIFGKLKKYFFVKFVKKIVFKFNVISEFFK